MYIDIFIVIKAFLLGWMMTHFEPFQTFIVGGLEGVNKGLFIKTPFIYYIFGQLIKPLSCMKCSCFWIAMILSGSIYVSIFTAIVGYTYDKYDGSIKIRL